MFRILNSYCESTSCTGGGAMVPRAVTQFIVIIFTGRLRNSFLTDSAVKRAKLPVISLKIWHRYGVQNRNKCARMERSYYGCF